MEELNYWRALKRVWVVDSNLESPPSSSSDSWPTEVPKFPPVQTEYETQSDGERGGEECLEVS